MKYTDINVIKEILPNELHTRIKLKLFNDDEVFDCIIFRNDYKENLFDVSGLAYNCRKKMSDRHFIQVILDKMSHTFYFDSIEFVIIENNEDEELKFISDVHNHQYDQYYVDMNNRKCPVVSTPNELIFGNPHEMYTHAGLVASYIRGEDDVSKYYKRIDMGECDSDVIFGHVTNNGYLIFEDTEDWTFDELEDELIKRFSNTIIKEFYIMDAIWYRKINL